MAEKCGGNHGIKIGNRPRKGIGDISFPIDVHMNADLNSMEVHAGVNDSQFNIGRSNYS